MTDQADEALYLAAAVVALTPTSNNLMVSVELAGGNRKALTASVTLQYMLAPILLPMTLTACV